ncbi:hypothetical protein C8R44DRAFT_726786 [Mycena epipterygia]|nr:hypothetical protein C8R44DRAFT_726786 [Mycena epipterygia]
MRFRWHAQADSSEASLIKALLSGCVGRRAQVKNRTIKTHIAKGHYITLLSPRFDQNINTFMRRPVPCLKEVIEVGDSREGAHEGVRCLATTREGGWQVVNKVQAPEGEWPSQRWKVFVKTEVMNGSGRRIRRPNPPYINRSRADDESIYPDFDGEDHQAQIARWFGFRC